MEFHWNVAELLARPVRLGDGTKDLTFSHSCTASSAAAIDFSKRPMASVAPCSDCLVMVLSWPMTLPLCLTSMVIFSLSNVRLESPLPRSSCHWAPARLRAELRG